MAINIDYLTKYRYISEGQDTCFVKEEILKWLEDNVGGPYKYRPVIVFSYCRLYKYSGPGWKILPPDLSKRYYRLEIEDESLALQFKLTWS